MLMTWLSKKYFGHTYLWKHLWLNDDCFVDQFKRAWEEMRIAENINKRCSAFQIIEAALQGVSTSHITVSSSLTCFLLLLANSSPRTGPRDGVSSAQAAISPEAGRARLDVQYRSTSGEFQDSSQERKHLFWLQSCVTFLKLFLVSVQTSVWLFGQLNHQKQS